MLCDYLSQEIEQQFGDLELTCGCNWHNPGEEQHIEIFVGIPEGEDSSDPKYDNLENDLELFVNKIGGEENEGQKWGDASFQWISDEEIFGELWPLGGEVKESTKKFKTNKGKVLMFKETYDFREGITTDEGKMIDEKLKEALDNAYNKAFSCFDNELKKQGFKGYDGDGEGGFFFNDFKNRKTYYVCLDVTHLQECEDYEGDSLPDEFDEWNKKFGKKFVKESCDEEFDRYYERMKNIFRYDSGIHTRLRDNEDGSETIEVTFDDRYQWDDDVESGKIPLDKDSRLEHWISRFDDAGHKYGWEFDYEIAKDIEHPIDGGANNDYLAMLTLTCKCDKEEDDLLFENSSESTDDTEKEFTYKGVTITRYDYESLPAPMAASKLSDEQMQEIAKDIYFELVNRGWDEKEIQKYVNNVDDYELPDAEMRIADKIRSDWWAAMEDVARYHGMEYYEDMPEDEM